MIRPLLSIVFILFLFSQMIAEGTGGINNTTVSIVDLNLTNSSINESQEILQNSTLGENQSVLIPHFNKTETNQVNQSNSDIDNNITNSGSDVDSGQSSITSTTSTKTEPKYKLSIGSTYDPDYTEPQPLTFTYSGCS